MWAAILSGGWTDPIGQAGLFHWRTGRRLARLWTPSPPRGAWPIRGAQEMFAVIHGHISLLLRPYWTTFLNICQEPNFLLFYFCNETRYLWDDLFELNPYTGGLYWFGTLFHWYNGNRGCRVKAATVLRSKRMPQSQGLELGAGTSGDHCREPGWSSRRREG